jgi:hypothetical protein
VGRWDGGRWGGGTVDGGTVGAKREGAESEVGGNSLANLVSKSELIDIEFLARQAETSWGYGRTQ